MNIVAFLKKEKYKIAIVIILVIIGVLLYWCTVGSKNLLHSNTTPIDSLSHPFGMYDNIRLGGRPREGFQTTTPTMPSITAPLGFTIENRSYTDFEKNNNVTTSYIDIVTKNANDLYTLYNLDTLTTKTTDPIYMCNYNEAKISLLWTYDQRLALEFFVGSPYVYTVNSPLSTTLVHCGLVKPNTIVNNVTIAILPSYSTQINYLTSSRNGVTPLVYASPSRCYVVYSIDGYVIYDFVTKNLNTSTGTVITLTLRGDSSFPTTDPDWGLQRVYGDSYYRIDSYLPRAAVHAGVIAHNEVKTVQLTITGYKSTFGGTPKNGITPTDALGMSNSFEFIIPPTTTAATTTTSPTTTTTTSPTTTSPTTTSPTTTLPTTTSPTTTTTLPTTTSPTTTTTLPTTTTTSPTTTMTEPTTTMTEPTTTTPNKYISTNTKPPTESIELPE